MVSKERNDILKYIGNEKDISKYKISTIEHRKNIPTSKKRILNMEKEFLELPLENMGFEDVADVAAAISIYRTSRGLFYKTYCISPPELYKVDKDKFLKSLNSKIKFIKSTGHTLMYTRVQELNLVQNSDFYYDLAKRQSLKNGTTIEVEKRQLDSLALNDLLRIEPITIAKKRARAQAAIYSMGKYLYNSGSQLKADKKMTLENLKNLNEETDKIIDNLRFNVFKFYNEALRTLPNSLDKTMGKNPYLSKLHNLQNILDFPALKKFGANPIPLSYSGKFSTNKPVLGNIFFGTKKAISTSPSKDAERNIQNKVFGILLPIPRKGNEKMTLLYKNIEVNSTNISHLFFDNLSNTKATFNNNEEYYKSLLMFPLWRLIEMSNADNASRHILSKMVGFNKDKFENINFNNKAIINKINNIHTGFLQINSDSVILSPKTRSEEEGILDIFSIINAKIYEIKEDYSKLVNTTNEIL